MKALILSLFFTLITVAVYSANPDSIAYQRQRAKINRLLAQRTDKFSQYSVSLNTKTGIFGWQTKKDIKRSSEILMDIAKTDEVIFREIKVLLDFKTYQNTQVVAKLVETQGTEERSFNYMKTINKLRDQNEKLQHDMAEQNSEFHQKQTIHIIIILLLILSLIFILYRNWQLNKV